MTTEWTASFFSMLYRDLFMNRTPAESQQIAAKILRLLRPPANAKILDAGCGTGEIAAEVASTGHLVTGVDAALEYIDYAQNHFPIATFIHGDFRKLEMNGFDAAFSWYSSLGYSSREDDLSTLRAISNSLVPGGRFLLEVLTAEKVWSNWRSRGG